VPVNVYNPGGTKRIVVTKPLPGDRWLECLIHAGARVEVCALDGPASTILNTATIKEMIGAKCDGAIGQLTEDWGGQCNLHTHSLSLSLLL
jgi:hydroxypyruvate reductase 1